MTIDTSMEGRDLYLRTTDDQGRATKTHHRVWSADLFMEAREADARKLNAEKKSTKASAVRLTAAQFHQSKG